MKKEFLKNALVSMNIVLFVLLIGFMIYESISDTIWLDSVEHSENFDTSMYTEEDKQNHQEVIQLYQSENGIQERSKDVAAFYIKGKQSEREEVSYVLILSVIIGSIIGYIKTLELQKLDKKILRKKFFLGYIVGAICVSVIAVFSNLLHNAYHDFLTSFFMALENTILYSVIYCIAFIIQQFKRKKDIKKLNDLMK